MKQPADPATLVAEASRRHASLALGTLDGTGMQFHSGGRRPPARDALFQIGSITKTFTALVLARAVVRGDVRLEDPIDRFLPRGLDLAPGIRDLTLGELATHTSGLPRLPPGSWRKVLRRDPDPYADIDEAALMRSLARVRLRRSRRPRYSNLGFGLLGHLLATTAGTAYGSLLAEEVTGPLGLTDTVIDPSPAQLSRIVSGHTRRLRARDVAWRFDAMAGAGALWSTVPDLLAYAAAHLDPPDGELGEALRLAMTPRTSARGAVHALGWLVLPPVTRVEGVFHDGGTYGYRSALVIEPQRGRAAAATTATDRGVGSLVLRAVLGLPQASTDTAEGRSG